MRVAIAGAGLGGLALAQGLKQAGATVTVYERDPALNTRRQGYRLHVDARAGLALQRCLAPDLFALVIATCAQASNRFTVMSERLRVLHEMKSDPARDPYAAATLSTSVNRQTLREILATGLDDDIRYGHALESFADADGEVVLRFADGATAVADVLVGADGVNSAVRRRYRPEARVVDTGNRCVYGKTPLDERTLPLIPPPLTEGFTAIVGGRIGMAAGLVRFRQRPEAAAPHLSPVYDYMMWAVSGDQHAFTTPAAEMAGMNATALHRVAMATIHGWHPHLRELVGRADGAETFLVPIRSAEPIPAWVPSRVTLLGDAIHAMSPARGSGANTALRDAALLCERLTGGGDPVQAIGAYEEEMRAYGFEAVRASREAEAETASRGNGLMFRLYRRFGGSRA